MKVKGSKRVTFELQPKEVELDMQAETTTAVPASPVQEPNTKSSSRKGPRKAYFPVRRSARIITLTPPLELTVDRPPEEDEREEPQPQSTFSADQSLEEKVDHPVQLVTEPIKSDKNDLTYRSLYFDSQKKVEALMEEKLELCKKLENAYGKIEVDCVSVVGPTEKGRIISKFEKFNDIMRFSLLSKGAAPAAKVIIPSNPRCS